MTFALLSLIAAGSLGSPRTEPIRLAFAPLIVTAPGKFAGPDREQTVGILSESARTYLGRVCDASTAVLVDPVFTLPALERAEIDFSKPGHRKLEKLQAFTRAVQADYAALAVIEWTDQKNAELRAIAANPNAGGSTSRVRIRLWLSDAEENKLMLDGEKKTFDGEAKGPYFGTVDTRELSGDPASKGVAIRAEYRKRARWLGQALANALKNSLLPALGFREPPE